MDGMKSCSKCGLLKPKTEFYDAPTNADGLKGCCKVCSIAQFKEYRKNNLEKVRRRDRESGSQGVDMENRRKYQRAWDKRNRAKCNAYKRLDYAIKKGTVEKQPCEVCGTRIRVVAHQDNPAAPLINITWLCHVHHHANMKEKAA